MSLSSERLWRLFSLLFSSSLRVLILYLYRLSQNPILFAPGFWRWSPNAECTNSATGPRDSLESERQVQAISAGVNKITVYFMNCTWNETLVLVHYFSFYF